MAGLQSQLAEPPGEAVKEARPRSKRAWIDSDRPLRRSVRLRAQEDGRGRGRDGSSVETHTDDGEPRPLKRARLTQRNLAQHEKAVGRLSHPHHQAVPVSTTRTISAAADADAHPPSRDTILDAFQSKPPANLEALRARCARSRSSPSPTRSEYRAYVDNTSRAAGAVGVPDHTTIIRLTRPLLTPRRRSEVPAAAAAAAPPRPKSIPFPKDVLPSVTDRPGGLPADPLLSRDDDDPDALGLLHLAGELVPRGADLESARQGAAVSGARLVCSRRAVLATYLETADPPGHACVATFATDGTTLELFAHYADDDDGGGARVYHQFPIAAAYLTNSYDEFRQGWRQLRNVQDEARRQTDELRSRLRAVWRGRAV